MCCVAWNDAAGWVHLSANGPLPFEAHCLSASQTLSDYWTSTGPKFLAANLVDRITPPVVDPVQAAKTIFVWFPCGEKCWQLQAS